MPFYKIPITAIAALLLLATTAEAEKKRDSKNTDPRFLRIQTKNGQPHSLQTAVTRYRSSSPTGATVDLIAAIHVGEASYYKRLNELMQSYDVVLYELVAPADAPVPEPGQTRHGSGNPLAMLQSVVPSTLGLESQLDQIDYRAENFVRADMTTEQIGEKMRQRGDTPLTLALSSFAEMMRQQNLATQQNEMPRQQPEVLNLFAAIGKPLEMKRMMAKQFTTGQSMDMMLGTTLNEMLIDDRNAEAVRVLQRQLTAGKRKIAIFYGAAHMPDFDQRLRKDFGLTRKRAKWIDAWDLTQNATSPRSQDEPADLLMRLFQSLDSPN